MTVKLKRRYFELLLDTIWVRDEHGNIIPTPFMFEWWSAAAKRLHGDPARWVDVAKSLGYVDGFGDPVRFDVDSKQLHASLGLPETAPLVFDATGRLVWRPEHLEAAYQKIAKHIIEIVGN